MFNDFWSADTTSLSHSASSFSLKTADVGHKFIQRGWHWLKHLPPLGVLFPSESRIMDGDTDRIRLLSGSEDHRLGAFSGICSLWLASTKNCCLLNADVRQTVAQVPHGCAGVSECGVSHTSFKKRLFPWAEVTHMLFIPFVVLK